MAETQEICMEKVVPNSERHCKALDFALYVLLHDSVFSKYVDEIYLYGSCARGEQKYRSDVDLLVKVLPETPPRIMRKMRVETVADDISLPEVELKFTTGVDFSTSRQFDENIRRDGKLLWKKV